MKRGKKGKLGNFLGKALGGIGSSGPARMLGSLGKTLGKTVSGGVNFLKNIFSDARMKENIQHIGHTKSGVNIYEFEYKDKSYGSGRYQGVMAQEVPWATSKAGNGYLLVDYSKVDADFKIKR